jgi:hypothetical protein
VQEKGSCTKRFWRYAVFLPLLLSFVSPAQAKGDEAGEGGIFTLWPLIDYRESPKERFSSLSILGPLFRYRRSGDTIETAVRPFLYRTENRTEETAGATYLYPLASQETTPEVTRIQALRGLYQKNVFRKEIPEAKREDSMFFPFYIRGTSEKYGPYVSVFPFWGDIYERFWRDEIHFAAFPLYARTVKNGTTTRNFLYPFFSVTKGERERGFQFWPLYGESSRDGVYEKRFALWPIFYRERSGLDTPKPVSKFHLLPLYAEQKSPVSVSRQFLWPFFGYSDNTETGVRERDYFWPLCVQVRGGGKKVDRFLPLYAREEGKETKKQWYLWPLYRHDELNSPSFTDERDRVLFFLYSDRRETWPVDGEVRRRKALWPLFVYGDDKGVRSVSFPAPVEPIVDTDGIEQNWAPLWRLFQARWNSQGESAASFLWNLYWHESRKDGLAFELFPALSYRSEKGELDVRVLKGLFGYSGGSEKKSLRLFWMPVISWKTGEDRVRKDGSGS